jgi:uncharacterized protein YbbC (DUF1343 family)
MRSNSFVCGLASLVLASISSACTVTNHVIDPTNDLPEAQVRPGITVLLSDSIGIIRGKRVALITNQTGVNERRVTDIELLTKDAKATRNNVKLAALFSPEHGIEGKLDVTNIPNSVEKSTGVPIYSLYTNQTVPPPDSTLRGIDVLLFDLQDIGTRTWTYEGVMLYAMRAAARNKVKFVVLDRPNPISGYIVEGPLLDSSIANPNDPAPGKPGRATGVYMIPMRHGMTMGELALYYKDALNIPVDLSIVPMKGWKRELWFDRTGLPWIKPSPNMPTQQSAELYPGIVMFEATNVSVGRGTEAPFQLIGAPWLRNEEVVRILRDREMRGVRFTAETIHPVNPTDGKFSGRSIPGIRITVTNRSAFQSVRVGAALFWAIAKTSRDSLRVDAPNFDRLLGSPSLRQALLRGDDPDMLDRELQPVYDFRERTRRYLLYK